MSHVCKFGDRFCGRWGYDSLCDYCKRAADLELAQRENEIEGASAARRREARDRAAEAVGAAIAEHPVAAGLTVLGFLGAAALASRDREDTTRGPLKPMRPARTIKKK